MNFNGQISKMITALNNPINYLLPVGNDNINVNEIIGKSIHISFKGEINCIGCEKSIKKTYMQGYCYPCFISLPQTEECVFKPHLCRAHIGEARDMSWSKKYCLTPTYVYLSLTSNLKVGVTRNMNLPSRWIDQGAHYAIKFAETPNRYLAGMIELEISKYISDRTKWRQMIKGEYDFVNLIDKKIELSSLLSNEYSKYIVNYNDLVELHYPMKSNPVKISSINLDKTPNVKGIVTGIKGQYMILDNCNVLNVRKYTGYTLNIEY